MKSDFSKMVMISLNEHMAQTLLDGMAATIRQNKTDLDMQVEGLEMLVKNLESLDVNVTRFMDELKSNKENTFSFDELDLEGLNESQSPIKKNTKPKSEKYLTRTPSIVKPVPGLKT